MAAASAAMVPPRRRQHQRARLHQLQLQQRLVRLVVTIPNLLIPRFAHTSAAPAVRTCRSLTPGFPYLSIQMHKSLQSLPSSL